MSEAARRLRAARALVAYPGGWTQGAFARDVRGEATSEHGLGAVCFCTMGALFKTSAAFIGVAFLRQVVGVHWFAAWSDAPGRTQAEVVEAFDEAIALAEAA